ncbi:MULTISPECIES: branched-chain amino acid ABC transporter permease [unclassified Beijerinckia]|uniref:branched-chain amino acid ABC transporter permease n=1 Tax=unclassified Beijerinckia TaxID=2638183 RepID=UPI001FCCC240|nr:MULTISPECIES: branched-chain amino acid ABC transporter permease [unclassified Beijerinckia]
MSHSSTPALRTISIVAGALVAVAFLVGASGYHHLQATLVLSYAVALLGLNILTGYSGQISLGQGAFFAIGAYATAIAMDRFAAPYWLTPAFAAIVCFIAGYLFGRPALKLEGLYLALATFALAVAMPQLLKSNLINGCTGGVQGIVLVKPEVPSGLPLTQDQWLLLFSALVTAVMFLLAHNLLRGGSGRAMRAIRDNAAAAEAMGVDRKHIKCMAFGISAAFTGVGGALSTIAIQFVAPDSFTVFLSISLLVGIVIGGMGTLSGAFLGAVFIMFVPTLAETISKDAPWFVYGVVLIVCMFAMPNGVVGLITRLRSRYGASHLASSQPAAKTNPTSVQ